MGLLLRLGFGIGVGRLRARVAGGKEIDLGKLLRRGIPALVVRCPLPLLGPVGTDIVVEQLRLGFRASGRDIGGKRPR